MLSKIYNRFCVSFFSIYFFINLYNIISGKEGVLFFLVMLFFDALIVHISTKKLYPDLYENWRMALPLATFNALNGSILLISIVAFAAMSVDPDGNLALNIFLAIAFGFVGLGIGCFVVAIVYSLVTCFWDHEAHLDKYQELQNES